MPSCRPAVIPGVIEAILAVSPRTILDVGVGHGKWGVLCDEYLRYWNGIVPIIDGVEVFKDYRSKAYAAYRGVYNCNVMDFVKNGRIHEYDLVLLVDVIEHLSREDGELLLKECKRYVVSTPGYESKQGAAFGNEHERHVSRWHVHDFDNSLIVNDGPRVHILGWR